VDVAIRSEALLGEGPRWDAVARRLLWVDIEAGALHLFDPARGEDRAIALGSRVGAAAPTKEASRTLVALADRLALVDLEDESLHTLVEIPHGDGMRLNDGVCDAAGRFWVGSMALDETPGAAALYRYSREAGLERVLAGVTLSNGLGWSPDGGTMYHVDSMTYRLDRFDFELASGAISNRRPFVTVERGAGIPDGLAVDDDGGIWVALWGGGAVRRYTPDGELDRTVVVPAERVTACCFGGADGRALYVTTASFELGDEERSRQPLAGSVFVADVGVSGPPAQPFAG
jgi:sugar lactone lactonase YvrE